MPSSHNGHISITGVSKYYGRHKALDDVSLEIPPGTVTVILGPSGSGLRYHRSLLPRSQKPQLPVRQILCNQPRLHSYR